MSNKIYILRRIGFDSMENHISAAIRSTTIGATEDLGVAEALRDQYERSASVYKGWDGNSYPKFKLVPVERLTRDHLGSCQEGHRWHVLDRIQTGDPKNLTTMVTTICLRCGQMEYGNANDLEAPKV